MLLAFVLTATVPYYCSTGWCCGKHKAEAQAALIGPVVPNEAPESDCCGGGMSEPQVVEESDCCGGGISEPQVVNETDCCGGGMSEPQVTADTDCCGGGGFSSATDQRTADNSCGGSCATGCCKLAATVFMFEPPLSIAQVHPVSMLRPATAIDTGTELTDSIPQPPRVLTA
ncbi:MAG: hypothetical protein H6508_01260 [Calditrichaeota bacterium]|nr:hypothetical protein [Calditrichota bacterium]